MTTKKEKGIGNKDIHLVTVFYNGGKRINTISEISVSADNIYISKGIRVSISNSSKWNALVGTVVGKDYLVDERIKYGGKCK